MKRLVDFFTSDKKPPEQQANTLASTPSRTDAIRRRVANTNLIINELIRLTDQITLTQVFGEEKFVNQLKNEQSERDCKWYDAIVEYHKTSNKTSNRDQIAQELSGLLGSEIGIVPTIAERIVEQYLSWAESKKDNRLESLLQKQLGIIKSIASKGQDVQSESGSVITKDQDNQQLSQLLETVNKIDYVALEEKINDGNAKAKEVCDLLVDIDVILSKIAFDNIGSDDDSPPLQRSSPTLVDDPSTEVEASDFSDTDREDVKITINHIDVAIRSCFPDGDVSALREHYDELQVLVSQLESACSAFSPLPSIDEIKTQLLTNIKEIDSELIEGGRQKSDAANNVHIMMYNIYSMLSESPSYEEGTAIASPRRSATADPSVHRNDTIVEEDLKRTSTNVSTPLELSSNITTEDIKVGIELLLQDWAGTSPAELRYLSNALMDSYEEATKERKEVQPPPSPVHNTSTLVLSDLPSPAFYDKTSTLVLSDLPSPAFYDKSASSQLKEEGGVKAESNVLPRPTLLDDNDGQDILPEKQEEAHVPVLNTIAGSGAQSESTTGSFELKRRPRRTKIEASTSHPTPINSPGRNSFSGTPSEKTLSPARRVGSEIVENNKKEALRQRNRGRKGLIQEMYKPAEHSDTVTLNPSATTSPTLDSYRKVFDVFRQTVVDRPLDASSLIKKYQGESSDDDGKTDSYRTTQSLATSEDFRKSKLTTPLADVVIKDAKLLIETQNPENDDKKELKTTLLEIIQSEEFQKAMQSEQSLQQIFLDTPVQLECKDSNGSWLGFKVQNSESGSEYVATEFDDQSKPNKFTINNITKLNALTTTFHPTDESLRELHQQASRFLEEKLMEEYWKNKIDKAKEELQESSKARLDALKIKEIRDNFSTIHGTEGTDAGFLRAAQRLSGLHNSDEIRTTTLTFVNSNNNLRLLEVNRDIFNKKTELKKSSSDEQKQSLGAGIAVLERLLKNPLGDKGAAIPPITGYIDPDEINKLIESAKTAHERTKESDGESDNESEEVRQQRQEKSILRHLDLINKHILPIEDKLKGSDASSPITTLVGELKTKTINIQKTAIKRLIEERNSLIGGCEVKKSYSLGDVQGLLNNYCNSGEYYQVTQALLDSVQDFYKSIIDNEHFVADIQHNQIKKTVTESIKFLVGAKNDDRPEPNEKDPKKLLTAFSKILNNSLNIEHLLVKFQLTTADGQDDPTVLGSKGFLDAIEGRKSFIDNRLDLLENGLGKLKTKLTTLQTGAGQLHEKIEQTSKQADDVLKIINDFKKPSPEIKSITAMGVAGSSQVITTTL